MDAETEQEPIEEGVDRRQRRRPRRQRPRVGKLKPERVQLVLETLPGWELAARGNALSLSRKFAQPGVAAKFAAFVAELSAVESHAVTLGITAHRVSVRLQRQSRNGIDPALLAFARQIN
jgi:pterin-4a-carbinolamine dehydratase